MLWTELKSKSTLPSPRAGTTLCNIENELYLFGGSGPSSSSFNDLHIYSPGKNSLYQRLFIYNREEYLGNGGKFKPGQEFEAKGRTYNDILWSPSIYYRRKSFTELFSRYQYP